MAQLLDAHHVVAYEQDGASLAAADVLHLADGFFLEFGIADGQDFVDDQYFRVEEGSYGKTKSDGHARAVSFDGGVDISFTAAEVDNLVQFAGNFGFGHAKDGAVEEDVFASGHLLVESRSHFEQGADTASGTDGACGGTGDFGEYLEQGARLVPP